MRQKIIVFQQNGSGENKIQGINTYGNDLFSMEIISIDEILQPVLDDTAEYLPDDIQADIVVDFLKHPDLSTDLAKLCQNRNIPIIASGKKNISWAKTPPT